MRPEETLTESFENLKIQVDDSEDEDLLQYFPAANAFIQSGLDAGGSVLIHWSVLTPAAQLQPASLQIYVLQTREKQNVNEELTY